MRHASLDPGYRQSTKIERFSSATFLFLLVCIPCMISTPRDGGRLDNVPRASHKFLVKELMMTSQTVLEQRMLHQ